MRSSGLRGFRAGAGALAVLISLTTALACSSGESVQLSEAAQRGKATYNGVCIACHNPDPNVDGSLGPSVAGSSRELIEARVVYGKYPPGYTPKRDSHAMPAFPHLADKVDDLFAFLDEAQRS